VRNINNAFNHKRPVEHIVKAELFYRRHKEKTEINVIREQKQSIILGMPWLACYNLEINWKTGEMKIMRCLDKCGKQ